MIGIERIEGIVILGTGNIAKHLSGALHAHGIKVQQIYGRNQEKAEKLARKYNARFCSEISNIDKDADAYFFCISDHGITEVLAQTNFSDQLLIHLSGTMNLNVFKGFSENYGVFYPLQTFSTDRDVDFSNIPVCIESNKEDNKTKLKQVALKLSEDVREIDSYQRSIIHVAAVFSCNFSNYLYTVAEKILDDHDLDFEILKPLILETAKKALDHPPSEVQTGPAKRKDHKIIKEHLKTLEKYPDYKELYELISQKIEDHYKI